MTEHFVVAGRHRWNRDTFERLDRSSGEWEYVSSPAELERAVSNHPPRYIFFLHWSDIVRSDITSSIECVCFHMTALPFGRGGSPLQNLLLDGHSETTLTAFRMVDELDAGPVYLTRPLPLGGSAEAIYARADGIAAEMMSEIVKNRPEPASQEGNPTFLSRRAPSMSGLPSDGGLDEVETFIRMLDAAGYPHAFLDHGRFRLHLRRAVRYSDRIEADVSITLRRDDEP